MAEFLTITSEATSLHVEYLVPRRSINGSDMDDMGDLVLLHYVMLTGMFVFAVLCYVIVVLVHRHIGPVRDL